MIRPMTPPNASHSSQTTAWAKVRLLLWKNWLLQKRHKIHTIVDIFLPVCFFIFCAWMQKSVGIQHVEKVIYPSLNVNTLDPLWNPPQLLYPPINESRLIFAPDNDIFRNIMIKVSERLGLDKPVGLSNSSQMEETFVKRGLIAGVEFHHSNKATELPKSLSYSLRFPGELRRGDMPSYNNIDLLNWQTKRVFPIDSFSPRYAGEYDGGPPSYYKEGFLAIQNAIAKIFVDMLQSDSNKIATPDIQVNRFPYPAYISNLFISQFNIIMPLFVLVSLNYTFMNTVRFISIEKEKQLKEAMKIMGLASWMHYLSWFIRTIVMLTIPMVLITVLLKWPWFGGAMAIFPHSNFMCLIIFLLGYCICLITMAFVICSVFTMSKSAMTSSTVVWYLSCAPFFLFKDDVATWLKLIFCIFPNTAMSYAFGIIAHLEDLGVGLNWTTAFQTVSVYEDLTVAMLFGYLIMMAIVLFFITLYVENVLPGGYGVAKPWYFICTKSFWQSFNNYQQFNDNHTEEESYEFAEANTNKSNFESEPINKTIGIEIRNLTKKFSNDKAAVSNLSLNIYNNQITCLLGQNGAGKTTTISMLTGMMEATTGTAIINGCDIRTNMDKARGSMGFCPQHNILFDELTVREHIIFYCTLKGLSAEVAEREAKKYGQILELSDKMDTLSTALSGGMKRKLSVVIALCGNSKIVFLDEPTSGMDPGARRTLWDILLAEKKDRAILLTTHFMDEADVLSDRIAILADGELKCAGSTFFLKKRFGTGYHLICAKDEDCISNIVTEILQRHIPDIRLEHENDTEISYLLPDHRNEQFQIIFEDLENNEGRLKISSFGISLTTLEEIFLKIGKSDSFTATSLRIGSDQSSDIDSGISDTRITLNDDHHLLRGPALWRNQTIAMFKKRYLCWIRAILSFLYYNFFVLFMLIFVIFPVGELWSSSKELPPMDITLNAYKSPYAILAESNSSIAMQYKKIIDQTSSAKLLTVDSDDMETDLLDLAKSHLKEFKYQYLVAVSFMGNETITAWFNNQAYHTAAVALNLVHNAIVKSFIGNEHGISVTNAPFKFLPKHNDSDAEVLNNMDAFGFTFSIVIGLVMSILSASYIQFYIKEKENNAKFMQYTSGAYMFVFWGASILWDLFTNSITIGLIIVMLAIGQHEHWRTPSELAIVFLILFVYNFAMSPVICLLSLIFSKPTTGMNVLSIANTVLLMVFAMNIPFRFLNKVVYYIFWSFPLCTMIDAIFKLPTFHTKELQCEAECKKNYNADKCDWEKFCKYDPKCCSETIFSWSSGISQNLVLMTAIGIVAYLLLVFIESGTFKFIRTYILGAIPRTYPYQNPENVDDDVAAEKERIDCMTVQELKSETIVMQNVSKFYGKFCAVNQISASVKRGECFGLLGKNGAGKSSIFKMLTGETIITSGEIFTYGYNQKSQLPNIYQMIGYCPQFDALLNGLTCRETLEIFAMLRGIPAQDVKGYIENCARSLDFIQHIDKKVKQLSGGNKRKLSTSLAIIGNLSVIFLDEPTTGMDPATKRNLWNVVIQSREAGKSIVLTSHSMEECEALCTRMTVLVNGLCKCLGSAQHLKNKFTKGFELKIKVKDDEMRNMSIIDVKNFVLQTFVGAIFREEYQGILTYSIPAENIRWSSVFGIMENAKKILKIDDYSVSQNSLEQVVLALVKDQEGPRNQK